LHKTAVAKEVEKQIGPKGSYAQASITQTVRHYCTIFYLEIFEISIKIYHYKH